MDSSRMSDCPDWGTVQTGPDRKERRKLPVPAAGGRAGRQQGRLAVENQG